jgi:hypothetical protein
MFASWFTPAVGAVHKTDSITPSPSDLSGTRSAALGLVLQFSGLDGNIRSLIKGYLNGTPCNDIVGIASPAGMGTNLNVTGRTQPLKSSYAHPPHTLRLWSKLWKGALTTIPAPPILTPPASPTESTTITQSGSEILFFDDGGALVYHNPEPNTMALPIMVPSYLARPLAQIAIEPIMECSNSSEPSNATHRTHCMAFLPMTPIMECSESPDLCNIPSPALQDNLTISTVSLQSYNGDNPSQLKFIMPFAPSAEFIDDLGLLEPADFESDDDLVLPNPYPEQSSDTVELQAPRPSRSQIDSAQFSRLLRYTDNDNPEGTIRSNPPDLEQCSTSGESSSGLTTPVGLDLEDANVAIASFSSSSYFGAMRSYESYKSKESSPFSSLLYVGQLLMPFDPPTESAFDPFGAEDDTLPPLSFEAAHVGVDIMNELLEADDEEGGSFSDSMHFTSPFDRVKDAILGYSSTTMEQQLNSNGPTFLMDRADTYSAHILMENDSDITLSSPDACDHADYDIFSLADSSDDDQEEEDEDLNSYVLEHDGIKYTISGELGQGTYGQVVFARTSLGEEVAIKICGKASDWSAPADLRKAVLNERNVLVRISGEAKPFLTQPLACFHDADNVYFVLVSSGIHLLL